MRIAATRCLLWLVLLLLSFAALAHQPPTLEECEGCQRVVFYAFQYFRFSTTKQFLRHRVKKLCNRHYEYRRRCMSRLVNKVQQIWADMESSLNGGPALGPFKTCEKIKECSENHSLKAMRTLELNGIERRAEAQEQQQANVAASESGVGETVTTDYIF